MHKPITKSFILIKNCVLYIIVRAILSYDWQSSRLVYSSITTNVWVMRCAVCDIPVGMTSLGNRSFSAPLSMEPLSYTQSILDWHIVGHMTIPKKHASELDIPKMYVATKPKDGENAILANWKCLVKYNISTRENLWIYVCFVCFRKGWVCATSKAWGGSQFDLEPTARLSFYTWV